MSNTSPDTSRGLFVVRYNCNDDTKTRGQILPPTRPSCVT